MKVIRKLNLVAVLLVSLSIVSYGQNVWNWPEDKDVAEEKNVIYTDAMKAKRYADAVEPLAWLLDNAPDLNPSLYINGVKIYTSLAANTSDPVQKASYQNKTLELYDKRIEYFGKEIDILNRKAYAAYKFYKSDQSKYSDLFSLYEHLYEKSGKRIHTNNMVAYMDVIRKYKQSGGNLSDDEIIDRYDLINEIMDAKAATAENAAKFDKYREALDRMLTSVVTVDCDFIQNNLGVKLSTNPSNTKLAKKIIGLSLAGKCSNDPVFLEAAIVVQKSEPTYGMAKLIGVKSNANGDFETAVKYYNEAIDLADDESMKADIYFELAVNYTKKNRKSQARAHALKAAKANPAMAKAYKLVGDLYLTSYVECKQGVSKVEDRAVYIAAYNMYKKAGDKRMMQSSLEQFPSIEDIFELNLEEGQAVKVGCWINETVTIKRRPS